MVTVAENIVRTLRVNGVAGFVTYGTDLENPDFAAVAEALGIFARRVERSEHLSDAVAEVLVHDGPALLDVVTERQELSMPPTVTAEQVKDFALYAIRTVMSGCGDELLDLARANWRQFVLTPGFPRPRVEKVDRGVDQGRHPPGPVVSAGS